ncbi:MAG: hypothetical protein J1E78_06740 [Muribaculaceae bacterium]|nr:hypothetical protein [Muribaculaceae bacterium]
MKNAYLLSIFATILVLLGGCKPTERGYKAAYDAALNKREAARQEIDVDLPLGAFQQVDGPQLRTFEGVEVYVMNQRITPVQDGSKLPGQYNVAIGEYKMVTNSRSQAADLKEEGMDAFAAKTVDGKYYTIAGSFTTMPEAIKFYQEYKSRKNRVYVGLPDSPVIIYSPM